MANRPAPALVLRDGDRDKLERLTRSSTVSAGAAQRARIVLLAADGVPNDQICELVGCGRQKVLQWRGRYQGKGMAGLLDRQRPGRPRTIDHRKIVAETLKPPPKKLGVTHWSTRLLAARLKVSAYTVAEAWRSYGVKPWRSESFRFSTDPELEAKVIDIVGLYLNPPENAIVLCVDEKSQIQALDRTMPVLPMQPGLVERRSHDYVRHGTTTLFAALEIATGKVTAALKPRHRNQEFLAFLKQVERAYRDVVDETGQPVDLHLVMDNYAAHKHTNVKNWLIENPRFKIHFTPTHASWMNLVEVWFSLIERQAIRRGVFTSVKDLNTKIRTYIDCWNERSHPFVWTRTADEILTKANRMKTSNPDH
ncbi:IS630 family transposase [Nocardioides sp. InS609-2]|uniref:IS630 family transposase n=1 Tax=Nocardioides sp. InS609-2 TaxID=2760705 RepID=UPI0020BDC9A8|nr:IS630 family transposase [Nocardioides sp. InS609-2]